MDGGIFIGRDAASGAVLDVAAHLRQTGLGLALAASAKALNFDFREGNAETLAACAASGGRLLPVGVVSLPGFDPGGDDLTRIKAAGFLAVGLFPALQGWAPGGRAFRALLRQAASLGLPVVLGLADRRELSAIADDLAEGPVLVRWMKGGGYRNLSEMIALGREAPQVMFDIGTLTQSGGIELLAARIGAGRLFLASNAPATFALAPVFLAWAARLPEADRQAVLTGNLRRLFGLPPGEVAPPPAWAPLLARPKIDTHWHTSGWNLIEPRLSPADLSAEFDAFGYRLVVSNSIRALNDDILAGNAETAALCAGDARVRGLVVVDPRRPAETLAELERWWPDRRFVGAKTIQDFYGLTLDDAAYAPILDWLARHPEWPLMAHLPGMAAAARAHPGLRFVAAHSTWRWRDLAALPNVHFDIATSTALRAETDIAALIAGVGAERVVFSCDGQLMSPAWTLGKLASLDLDEATLETVLNRAALLAFPRLA
ncbi:MAG: hypothetical protein OHK0024_32820 [Thalassobaculales bacterium]